MTTFHSTIGCLALVLALAHGQAGAAQAGQPASAPARSSAQDKAQQEEIQRLADQIVRDRLAQAEAERRLGTADMQRKLEAEMEAVVPLDVEVIISRYQGEKKVSSLPFSLVVNASRQTIPPTTVLRMGGKVPMPMMTSPVGPDGKPLMGIPTPGVVNYTDIGTQIDSSARPLLDGRFELTISVEDSGVSMANADTAPVGTLPVIRTFQARNTIVLRDGQTRQFTVASDRITGESVRVDVTLKVAK